MRLAAYRANGALRRGLLEGDNLVPLGVDPFDFTPTGPSIPLYSVELEAPVEPGKVICVGLNYADHVREAGVATPARPVLFAKFSNAIAKPEATLRLPAVSSQIDYEAELGVVIGRVARAVAPSEALQYVLGYTCVNDISARDLQAMDGQWTRGKSLDDSCPIGPFVVTTDEVGDGSGLRIRCRVNGRTVQDSSTSEMIFDVAHLVSFISHHITLEPGDLIATGTPPGVGFVAKPPLFLADGDVVEVDIDKVGILRSTISFREQVPV